MSSKNQHRAKFIAVRACLQKHDPLRLVEQFGGDRFDAELYGYEANSLLESVRGTPNIDAVESWLVTKVRSRKINVSEDSITDASAEIWNVLKSF